MDGVSTAASLIAVATIALQSTKIIYETVTGIHNGPSLLQQLASELRSLQEILKRIIDLSKDPAQANFTDFKGLESLSQGCATDVQNMERKLASLGGGKKLERAWKKLKTYLDDKYLEEVRTRIWHHVQALTAELGVTAIDDLSRMNSMMQSLFASSATRTGLLSDEIKATYGLHAKSVDDLSEQNSRNHLTAMDAMQSHCEDLGRVHYAVEALQQVSVSCNARLEEAASSARNEAHQVSQAITSISTRVDGLSSISQDQYETLKRMLEEISRNQKARGPSDDDLSHNTTGHVPKARIDDCPKEIPEDTDAVTDGAQSPPEQLLESIQRLWSFASKTHATYFSEDAQTIIEDFEKLLFAASDSVAKRKAKASRERGLEHRHGQNDADELRSYGDLKRVRGLLTASRLVHMAKTGSSHMIESLQPLTRVQSSSETIRLQNGTLTVLSRSQDFRHGQRRPKDRSPHAGDDRDQELLEVFTSTVTFTPADITLRAKLYANFVQKITTKEYFSIHPTLSFCSMIPGDSKVFQLIAKGDMEELQNMFRENVAAVTDCDPYGRSLLSCAYYNDRPEICRLLLQHGADPNSLERGWGFDENVFFPMLQQKEMPRMLDGEDRTQEYEETLLCRQLLLDAGSDPYIRGRMGSEGDVAACSYLDALFRLSDVSTELKKQVIDCDGVWLDMEHDDGFGNTPLLLAAQEWSYQLCPETVELLIKRGANVAARSQQGQACLHLLLRQSHGVSYNVESCKRCLTLLVNAGADVDAVDNLGNSVSEVAIRHGNWEIWQEVLQNCGKDVDQVCATLREKGCSFPGDTNYNSVEKSEQDTANNDSQAGSDSDDDGEDDEGGVNLDLFTS